MVMVRTKDAPEGACREELGIELVVRVLPQQIHELDFHVWREIVDSPNRSDSYDVALSSAHRPGVQHRKTQCRGSRRGALQERSTPYAFSS